MTIPKVFVSYSHNEDDRRIAVALQRALVRFKRPYYVRRAVSVFRDQTDLSASPQLWSRIAQALQQADFLILGCRGQRL